MSNRCSIWDYRNEDGSEVITQRPPFAGDVAKQRSIGIDVGFCPRCKDGGKPRVEKTGVFLPHQNYRERRPCR